MANLLSQLERLKNLLLLLVLELKNIVVKQIDKLSLPLHTQNSSGIALDGGPGGRRSKKPDVVGAGGEVAGAVAEDIGGDCAGAEAAAEVVEDLGCDEGAFVGDCWALLV